MAISKVRYVSESANKDKPGSSQTVLTIYDGEECFAMQQLNVVMSLLEGTPVEALGASHG